MPVLSTDRDGEVAIEVTDYAWTIGGAAGRGAGAAARPSCGGRALKRWKQAVRRPRPRATTAGDPAAAPASGSGTGERGKGRRRLARALAVVLALALAFACAVMVIADGGHRRDAALRRSGGHRRGARRGRDGCFDGSSAQKGRDPDPRLAEAASSASQPWLRCSSRPPGAMGACCFSSQAHQLSSACSASDRLDLDDSHGEYTRPTVAGGKRDNSEIGPAYLIAGTDEAKLDATLARLRARAESEGGAGALHSFSPPPGSAGPPPRAWSPRSRRSRSPPSAPSCTAAASRRWSPSRRRPWPRRSARPPDVTVVLVARERASFAPKRLAEAVEAAGGDVVTYAAPSRASCAVARRRGPRARLRARARRGAAARRAHRRLDRPARDELDRLATWAGPVARSSARTSRRWSPARPRRSCGRSRTRSSGAIRGRRLRQPGGSLAGRRVSAADLPGRETAPRGQHRAGAARRGRAGEGGGVGARSMHPYAAKMLLRRVRGRSVAEMPCGHLRDRRPGMVDARGLRPPEPVALTLAVRRAAGA